MSRITLHKIMKHAAATTALTLAAAPAAAVNYSFIGNFTDPNTVQLFTFTVGTSSTVTLRSWSYAGGTNSAGQTIAGGNFDPILTLFNSSGNRIAFNDDGGSANVPADPNTGRYYDVYLQQLLAPGTYQVAITAFSNFNLGTVSQWENDGTFNGRGTAWAFDVLNVDTAVNNTAVPEPATWAMMVVGFGAVGFAMRRKQAATVRFA